MNKLQKVISVALVGVICCGMMTSCVKKSTATGNISTNEILTFTPIDESKTVITVRTEFNVLTSDIEKAIEDEFPNVDAIVQLYAGMDTGYGMTQQLAHHMIDDIVFSANLSMQSTTLLQENLMDLSSEVFTTNYLTSALNSYSREGKLYYLPGPTDVQGIVYDKTLFKEHGWQLPRSLNEFVALCHQIEQETDLRAVQWSFKWPVASQTVTTGFSGELYAAADFTRWMEQYTSGKGSFRDKMTPALENMKYLIDENIIRAEDLQTSPSQRSTMFYMEHTAAMIMETQSCVQRSKNADNDHEIGMMPFWCGNDSDSDYVVLRQGYQIGVNKNLQLKGNEEKLAAVKEILAYFSTPKGQAALSDGSGSLSNVKDTSYASDSILNDLGTTIEKGNYVPVLNFLPSGENNEIQLALANGIASMVKDGATVEETVKAIDAARDAYVVHAAEESTAEDVVAQASTTFTRLETGLYLADTFLRTSGADIALAYIGDTTRGSFGRFYEGDVITSDIFQVSCENSTHIDSDYGNCLMTVDLTGNQILKLLNMGEKNSDSLYSTVYCYYAPAGIRVTYAPYAQNKIVSINNMDGSKFDLDKTYTVAMWNGAVSKATQEELGLNLIPQKTFPGTFTEIITAAAKADGILTPFDDGRFILDKTVTSR